MEVGNFFRENSQSMQFLTPNLLTKNSCFIYFQDDNDDDSEESQQPVPRNFILNKDPLNYQPHPSPNLSGGHSKQPPPPPPLRTRPSVINSRLKPSDSSFGLHSPDNLPLGFNPQDGEVQVRILLHLHYKYVVLCFCFYYGIFFSNHFVV